MVFYFQVLLAKVKSETTVRKMLLLIVTLITAFSFVQAQTVLFTEDFESGTASTDWQLYRAGEEAILAIAIGK